MEGCGRGAVRDTVPGSHSSSRVIYTVVARVRLGDGVSPDPDTDHRHRWYCISCYSHGHGRSVGELSELPESSNGNIDSNIDGDMSGMSGMSDVNADTDTASVVSVANADGNIDRRSS